LIREAKLFSEKSSQENKIFIDCSAESTEVGMNFGSASGDREGPVTPPAARSALQTPNSELRTPNTVRRSNG
jgi:hypothetical protein